jgi:cardiolipin synthase
MHTAFLLFAAAAVSDGVDGFLAKRFNMRTVLGAYLDPLADKVMIVSIYVTLGISGVIPVWIVILVVSRDIMIVGAIILSWLIDRPVKIKPHLISKANTAVQLVFAALVLASHGYRFDAEPLLTLVMALVAVLTLLSVGLYLAEWVRHMNSVEAN